jgi:PAS domain S-box-containing protein
MKEEHRTKRQLIKELEELQQQFSNSKRTKTKGNYKKDLFQLAQFALNNSNDAIAWINKDARILYVNDTACKLLGYSREEMLKKTVHDIDPAYTPDVWRNYWKQLKLNGSLTFETIAQKKDGTIIPMEITANYFKHENNEYNFMFSKDITKRKEAERELKEYRRHLEDLVNKRTVELSIVNQKLKEEIGERKKTEEKLVEYQERLRFLASQLASVEEGHRQNFATYLHDQIGQMLFILKIRLEMIQKSMKNDDGRKNLEVAFQIIEKLIENTRTLTHELSPPILHQLGLESALEWLVEQTNEKSTIAVIFKDDKQPKPLDVNLSTLMFRSVSELLVNVIKHANAHNAIVSLQRYDTSIKISVEDDGVGFDTSETGLYPTKNKKFGLFSIKERLNHLDGDIEIKSTQGKGTQVTLLAPLKH